MPIVEKRFSPRRVATIPLRFRVLQAGDGSAPMEVASEASNISLTGLFMSTSRKLPLGTPLCLTLHVPTALSGSYRSFLSCVGQVVHARALPDGKHGYGIHFVEALPLGPRTPAPPRYFEGQVS